MRAGCSQQEATSDPSTSGSLCRVSQKLCQAEDRYSKGDILPPTDASRLPSEQASQEVALAIRQLAPAGARSRCHQPAQQHQSRPFVWSGRCWLAPGKVQRISHSSHPIAKALAGGGAPAEDPGCQDGYLCIFQNSNPLSGLISYFYRFKEGFEMIPTLWVPCPLHQNMARYFCCPAPQLDGSLLLSCPLPLGVLVLMLSQLRHRLPWKAVRGCSFRLII